MLRGVIAAARIDFQTELLDAICNLVAENLRAMPSSPPGRRPDRRVLTAARALEVLVRVAGGSPVASEIAGVVKATWPERYRRANRDEAGVDESEAARKLLARARKTINLEHITTALHLPGTRSRPKTPRRS